MTQKIVSKIKVASNSSGEVGRSISDGNQHGRSGEWEDRLKELGLSRREEFWKSLESRVLTPSP